MSSVVDDVEAGESSNVAQTPDQIVARVRRDTQMIASRTRKRAFWYAFADRSMMIIGFCMSTLMVSGTFLYPPLLQYQLAFNIVSMAMWAMLNYFNFRVKATVHHSAFGKLRSMLSQLDIARAQLPPDQMLEFCKRVSRNQEIIDQSVWSASFIGKDDVTRVLEAMQRQVSTHASADAPSATAAAVPTPKRSAPLQRTSTKTQLRIPLPLPNPPLPPPPAPPHV